MFNIYEHIKCLFLFQKINKETHDYFVTYGLHVFHTIYVNYYNIFYISLLNQLYAIIIIFNIMNLQRNYSIKTKKIHSVLNVYKST